MIDPKLAEAIAKSDFKDLLFPFLKQVKDEIADIRNGDYTHETRKAVIDVIDNMIINKIRPLSGSKKEEKTPDESSEWH